MSDLFDLTDERANAIFSFYNNVTTYYTQQFADGDLVVINEGYEKTFHEFNELIKLYHSELKSSIGYLTDSSGYLASDEGNPDSGFWWNNSKPTNSNAELFFTNVTATSYYYRVNNKIEPYARHPYLYWDQYHVDLGSFDNLAWKNVPSRSSYTDTQNPFATGSNFRMAEPLEYWGDSNNLLWGRIVYDGRWVYRNRYINDTSYSTHSYTGFYDYETPTRSLTTLVDSNIDPTPWSIMRDTRWSSGTNDLPLLLVTHTIQNHSGTTTGTFDIPLTESPSLGNLYHNAYNDDTDEIFTFEITGSNTVGSVERYSYINGTPAITAGDLNSSSMRLQSDYSITNHTGGSSGTFRISGDPSISTGWYLVCTTNSSYGFVLEITNVTDVPNPTPPPTSLYTEYDYENAIWPTPNSGELNSDHVFFIRLPSIPEGVKAGSYTDGRSHVWTEVYNNYYNAFKSRLDGIVAQTQEINDKLNDILNFDYTWIEDPSIAGSQLFVTETQTYQSAIASWLSSWISLYGGDPASYATFDSKWSNSSLDSLINDGTGGIKQLIDFSPNYNGTRSGILYDRLIQIYDDIVGEYSLGSNEQWNPSQQQSSENNTGQFTSGTLNRYRYNAVSSRLNKEDGALTQALQAWYTWNNKLNVEIPALELELDPIVIDREYDIVPENLTPTTDLDDRIELEWDAVKSASSYTIEYKEGISGAWTTIEESYGYVEPATIIPFLQEAVFIGEGADPPASFIHFAYISAQQELVAPISIIDIEEQTGLSDDFTVYDFIIEYDSQGQKTIEIRGLDALTWEALGTAISNYFDENNIEVNVNVEEGNAFASTSARIRFTSTLPGSNGFIEISPGTSNDLVSALSASISTQTQAQTFLERGKSYFYRIKTNNGYNVSLGSDGDVYGKDWDSHSFWSTSGQSALGDQPTHGVAANITWPSPTNFLASGVTENSLTPSESYVKLEWDPEINAASYKIYRATSINGGYSLIGSSSINSYEDTTAIPGFVYYYSIQSAAGSDYQVYDDSFRLSGVLLSDRTEPIQGKRLWQTITLEASTNDRNQITLGWTPLAGATGYVVYKSTLPNGPFNPITNDDATDRVITGTSYIDDEPAKHFASTNFTGQTDGIADGGYIPNHRYYFIVVASDLNGLPTVKQYFITSPASGTWEAQSIADDIDQKLTDLNVADCELLPMENLEDSTVYKVVFTTRNESEQARIEVIDGTFGDSLLPLLGGMEAAQGGGSAFPGIDIYYRVQAVEIVAGSQVRASEFSNIALGKRPII